MAGSQTRAKAQRRQRVPFAQPRRKLGVQWVDANAAKQFVARWFNDTGDRLVRAKQAGYEFVNSKEVLGIGDPDVDSGNTAVDSRVSRHVGLDANNQPVRAYLMKIDKDLYQEDQDAKEERNVRTDQQIKDGTAGGAGVENSYGSVKVRDGVGSAPS